MLLLQPIFVFACVMIQMYLCGFAIIERTNIFCLPELPIQNIWLKSFFALVIGFGINISVLFFLGIFGYLTPFISVAGLLGTTFVLLALNSFQIRFNFKKNDLVLLIASILILIAIIFYCIHPTGLWDDTMYHLPEGKLYAQNHKIIFQPYLRYPLFPQNMSMLFSFAFMTGGTKIGQEILAQIFATLPIFINGIGFMGLFAWICEMPLLGVFSSWILLRFTPVRYTLGYAYVDNATMMFCFAALISAKIFLSIQDTKNSRLSWIFLSGAFAGFAIGTKYPAAIVAIVIGLWLLIFRRKLKIIASYCAGITLFGTWWSIRAWIISGDPLHPFGAKLFGQFLWNDSDYTFQKWQISNESISKDFTHLFSSFQQAGLLSLLLVPLNLIFWKQFTNGIKLLFCTYVTFLGVWYFVGPVPRFLAPIVAIHAFFYIWFIWKILCFIQSKFRISDKLFSFWMRYSTLITLIAIFIPVTKLTIKSKKRIRYSSWSQTLNERPFYSIMQEANYLKNDFGDRMLGVDCQFGVYYYDGLLIGVDFGPGRTREMIRCPPDKPCEVVSPSEMKALMSKHKTNMLIVNIRTIHIDVDQYKKFFDLRAQNSDAVLFTMPK